MHFWNIKAVAEQLKKNSLSEWGRTRYLIAAFVFPIITSYTVSLVTSQHGWQSTDLTLTLSALLIEVLINIFGFIQLFNWHKRSNSNNFIERVICFSVPASTRTFVIGWLAWALFLPLLGATTGEVVYDAFLTTISKAGPIIPAIYFNLLFFFFMRKGFQFLMQE